VTKITPTLRAASRGKVLIAAGGTAAAELYDGRLDVQQEFPMRQTVLSSTMLACLALQFSGTLSTAADAQTLSVANTDAAPITGTSNSTQVSTPAWGFSPTGSMVTAREEHRAVLLHNGTVLVVGGMHWTPPVHCFVICSWHLSALTSAELFHPTTGKFTPTGAMSAPRVFFTATLLGDGKVLIAGGDNRYGTTYATAQLFDPATGIFTSTGNMSVERSAHTATVLTNGKVLVAGGSGATAEVFEPATGKFTPTGNMTASRSFHTATLLSDGKVLLAGGSYGIEGSTAEIYNPATGTFERTGKMSVERSSHTATLLTSGKVLVTGGANSVGVTATAELFDPVIGTFAPVGRMLSPREVHTATRLLDGKVLVAGGIVGKTALSSAEFFNPATGQFTPAGNMETQRYEQEATLLLNGDVLITGGINFDNTVGLNSLATAELFL
jgi:Galactose oxidase, central domain